MWYTVRLMLRSIVYDFCKTSSNAAAAVAATGVSAASATLGCLRGVRGLRVFVCEFARLRRVSV